jgi:hypothetical protein
MNRDGTIAQEKNRIRTEGMPQPQQRKGLTLSEPAVYRIVVQGRLDESMSDRLGGMRITTSECPGHTPETTLVGRLRDQAALSGVLNSLYELHLPVLSVELVHDEKEA